METSEKPADDVTSEESNDSEETVSVTENAITLDEGNYVVGEDLSADRYHITAEHTGNIFIENNSISGATSDIIEDEGLNLGVPSVTVDLIDGAEIEIADLDPGIFTPVKERTTSDTLTTGAWEVGTDIEAGNYEVIPSGERSGKIVIFDEPDSTPVYDELIDKDGELGAETLTVELTEGQILRVDAIPEVTFQLQ